MRPVPPAGAVRGIFALLTLTLLAINVGPILAGDHTRPAGRFDDKIRRLEGGAPVVVAQKLDSLDPDDALRTGWTEFSGRHGGSWKVYIDERTAMPTLASGQGIGWFSESSVEGLSDADVEAQARAFLAENVALLGDWNGVLEYDAEASHQGRDGSWMIVFRQQVDGVRIEDARLDLHVKQGRLIMLGAANWGAPTISGVPTVDPGKARETLNRHVGADTLAFEQIGEPELVMLVRDADVTRAEPGRWTGTRGEGLAHVLVWRLGFKEQGAEALWVGEVDAHDGSLRAFYDGAQYASVRGGVFPIEATDDCDAGGCEIAGFPMPFADFTESGQSEQFADAFGNMTCGDGEASFETNLSGPYFHVNDACGATSEFGVCGEGVDLGLKYGENCDVAPGSSAGNTAAARSSYYHLNRMAEMTRFYDPTNTWLNNQVTVNVNTSGSCNANWNGDINMTGAGSNCSNTGESQGVLVHEWGHGYDYNDGGGPDKPSEGYADIVSIFYARQSCVDPGFRNDGTTCGGYGDTCLTCTGLREMDWAARAANTPVTPLGFVNSCPADSSSFSGPCKREAHCESYLSSEAMFDLATRDLPATGMDQDTAWQLAERLWYESRPGSGGDAYLCWLPNVFNSCAATSWYQRMRVADDDDGDLANGTPHAAALFAAFDRHEIACGASGDAENQSTSSCPTLAAPSLSVVETPSGTELSWGAVSGAAVYRVYRGDLGCDRQQVALTDLPGGTTTYLDTAADQEFPRYYRVEAFTSNPACHSPVSNCEATPLGARLQSHSHRLIEPGTPNGLPEPGETVQVPVTLFNSGLDNAVGAAGQARLADSSMGRVLEQANWGAVPAGGTMESDDPHFELVLMPEAPCGGLLTLEYDVTAANSPGVSQQIQFGMGVPTANFFNPDDVAVPPETVAPVLSTIEIAEAKTIVDVDIYVDLDHDLASELIVELTSPDGTTVRLHNQSAGETWGIQNIYDLQTAPDGPGSMDDFIGETTGGTWTLSIEDVGSESIGDNYLRHWTLYFTVSDGFGCAPQSCGEPTPTEAPSLAVEVSGPSDLLFSWSAVAAAGYHVLQSTSAAFDADVDLLGRTTAETTHTVTDGLNAAPDLIFYQVRGVNSCNHEGP